MLSPIANALCSVPAARRVGLRVLCLLACCWVLALPVPGLADNPPGAPSGTRIMLYNPQGIPEDVTTRYSGGHVTDFYSNPPIPLTFNYSSQQVFDTDTGDSIGYMVYPSQ